MDRTQLRKLSNLAQKFINFEREEERVKTGKKTVQTLKFENDKLKEKLQEISNELKCKKR